MPGVPDVLLCDEQGGFHFIELKATGNHAVELRPHQVAWAARHSHASVWILIRKVETDKSPQRIYLYPGSASMDLRFEGLKLEPAFSCEGLPDCDAILGLICPAESHIIP